IEDKVRQDIGEDRFIELRDEIAEKEKTVGDRYQREIVIIGMLLSKIEGIDAFSYLEELQVPLVVVEKVFAFLEDGEVW
ncbi:MAG: hypothetical protein KKF44_06760, partial [Nanoarchaeota archaeon]|nr:hypothetical protein [Nanoarchaeota archaeon]